MKFKSILVLQALAWLATAVPTTFEPAVQADWDAIIVGGGPAGLSAASVRIEIENK